MGRPVSPLRALAGGVAGTAAMTAALAVETRLLSGSGRELIDYDDSDHVVIAACRVLRRSVPRTERGRRTMFLQVHWGYGSAVALAYLPIRRRTRTDVGATMLLYAGCQAMALTLFPALGGTPAPWRWPRGVLVSSLGIHALYALTVGLFAGSRQNRHLGVAAEPASGYVTGSEPC